MKRFSVFDLDGTLLTCNSSISFCHFLYKRNVLSLSQLSYCFFRYLLFKRGFLSLHQLHRDIFFRLFVGVSVDLLNKHLVDFIPYLQKRVYKPAFKQLQEALAKGFSVSIFSSSPQFLIAPLVEKWGPISLTGSAYTIDKSGKLCDIAEIIDGEGKALRLKEIIANSQECEVAAFSDSILDLPFLQSAHRPVAVRPDKKLHKQALKKGWEIL